MQYIGAGDGNQKVDITGIIFSHILLPGNGGLRSSKKNPTRRWVLALRVLGISNWPLLIWSFLGNWTPWI